MLMLRMGRYTSLAKLDFSEVFHADIEHHSQSLLRKVMFSTQFSDTFSELNWLKVHFVTSVSSFVKNSQTAETVGRGNMARHCP